MILGVYQLEEQKHTYNQNKEGEFEKRDTRAQTAVNLDTQLSIDKHVGAVSGGF